MKWTSVIGSMLKGCVLRIAGSFFLKISSLILNYSMIINYNQKQIQIDKIFIPGMFLVASAQNLGNFKKNYRTRQLYLTLARIYQF